MYEELAHCTRAILARPRGEIEELARRCTATALDELAPASSYRIFAVARARRLKLCHRYHLQHR